jgi:hypothetical protein
MTEINIGLEWKAIRFTKVMTPKRGRSSNIYIKVHFKLTLVRRDKEGHFILIKGTIHQEEITIINFYAPNINAPNFFKHAWKELRSHTDPNTVVVGDFNTFYHQEVGHPDKIQ